MATYPHCDSNVLHSPGECIYCDKHPTAQARRKRAGINFTGHYNLDKLCPAEQARPLDKINRWHGNIPMTKELQKEETRQWKIFWGEYDDVGPLGD